MSANNKPFHINLSLEHYSNDLLWRIILFVGALASIAWSVYFSMVTITMHYQIELREGTALVLTRILLNGENPFSFENQPLAMTNYGLGYNLAVLPFAALFGNSLFIHRAITFVFILLSALVCFVTVYKKQRDSSLALICGAFAITGLIGQGGIGAFPSATGLFLFLIVVLVPYNRSFDRTSLLASVLVSLFAFYTKPYFILGFGIVATYLFLFVSKKKGVSYCVQFSSLFFISFLVMRIIFPLYFINTILGNISNTYRSSEHLKLQLLQLFYYFYPTLILVLIMLVRGLLGKREGLSFGSKAENLVELLSWDQPFIRHPINYLFYSVACSFLAFILILGPHTGNYMNYAYQLLVPLFFCWFFQNIDLNNKFRAVSILLVLFNLFMWELKILNPDMLMQKNSKEWAKLYNYVKLSKNVLNSPIITSEVVEIGLIPIDAGQSLVFYNVEPYPDFDLFGPPYSAWQVDGYQYTIFIDQSIAKQNFDLVVTTVEKATFYHVKRLPKYYSQIEEIKIDMPQTGQRWTILLWRPLVK